MAIYSTRNKISLLKVFSSLTVIESCFNKRTSREITSLQKRKNSPLGGHKLTGNE